jgi:hypothetical protein
MLIEELVLQKYLETLVKYITFLLMSLNIVLSWLFSRIRRLD